MSSPEGAEPLREPTLSVVLPTYEEAANIGPLVRRIAAALEGLDWEILVMDDRSPDGTAERAREAGAATGGAVQVIERRPPPGLTASIREGVERARGQWVSWMDCDLSHPPELLPELLSAARPHHGIAIASRYAPGGADRRDAFTRLYSRVINRLGTLLVHSAVRDYTSGYVLGPRERILGIGLRGDYGEYCIELLGIAAQDGVPVVEVPYAMVPREEGDSKTVAGPLRFVRRGLRYLAVTGRLAVRRLRPRPPRAGG